MAPLYINSNDSWSIFLIKKQNYGSEQWGYDLTNSIERRLTLYLFITSKHFFVLPLAVRAAM
jgi:hypothetical protein